MNDSPYNIELQEMRRYYETGATRTYAYRMQQLRLLKRAVLENEQEISDALNADLKKSPEEAYGTETGLLLSEINYSLRNLRRWMKPRNLSPTLLNFPSSGKLYPDPLGVALIIAPWNYPLQLSLVPLVGAIAAGNCVVLKPSELAPATAAVIEKILKSIFPTTYVKVVQGPGAIVVPGIMKQFRFDHIFYTGSIAVGKAIYESAAKELIPVTLELGGKSPAVVEKDADISSSARRIVFGKFTNAGQTCVAPDYLLVHEDIADKFIGAVKETMRNFLGENPLESHDYGKIINLKQFDKIASYLTEGEIVAGGQKDRNSLFVAPTILKNVAPDSNVMKEEIFGPVLPVIIFKSMDEAMAIVKQHPTPLAFYVFTKDKQKEKTWMASIAFGGGCVNNTLWHFANLRFPFGGIGSSGIGAYHGKYSFDTFIHYKPVMKTPTWFDPGIKYPPYKGKLKWFKRLVK